MHIDNKKYNKLINETNRMIKFFSNSIKSINFNQIKYLIFHRNGICTAILDRTITSGEMLIISRFINIIINNNFMELTDLSQNDIITLLESLLRAIPIQNNVYFTTTIYVILTQKNIIKFLCQNDELLQIILEWLKNDSDENIKLIKSTITSLLQFSMKQLEYVIKNESISNTTLCMSREIIMYTLFYSLIEISVNNETIQQIAEGLIDMAKLFESDNVCNTGLEKDFCVKLIKQLKNKNNLNAVGWNLNILRSLVPHIAENLGDCEIVSLLCYVSISLLQRTVSIKECVLILEIIDIVISRIMDNNFQSIFSNKSIIKQLMGFIRILPISSQHSEARNKLWWRILCYMDPKIFQEMYKKYLLPFLENLIGSYLDDSSKNYGLSEYTIKNGYTDSYSLACHVFTNLMNHLKLNNRFCQIQNGLDHQYELMKEQMFKFPDESLNEFKLVINESLLKWNRLLKRMNSKRHKLHSENQVKQKNDYKICNWNSEEINNIMNNLQEVVKNKKSKIEPTDSPQLSCVIPQISDNFPMKVVCSSESKSTKLSEAELCSQASANSCSSIKETIPDEKALSFGTETEENTNSFLAVPISQSDSVRLRSHDLISQDTSLDSLSDATERAESQIPRNTNTNSFPFTGISGMINESPKRPPVRRSSIKLPKPKSRASLTNHKAKRSLNGKLPKSDIDVSFNVISSNEVNSNLNKAELKIRFDLDTFKSMCSGFFSEQGSGCGCGCGCRKST